MRVGGGVRLVRRLWVLTRRGNEWIGVIIEHLGATELGAEDTLNCLIQCAFACGVYRSRLSVMLLHLSCTRSQRPSRAFYALQIQSSRLYASYSRSRVVHLSRTISFSLYNSLQLPLPRIISSTPCASLLPLPSLSFGRALTSASAAPLRASPSSSPSLACRSTGGWPS